MRNWISLLLLLALLLGSPAVQAPTAMQAPTALQAPTAGLHASAEPVGPAAANPRFVVFEGFYSLD